MDSSLLKRAPPAFRRDINSWVRTGREHRLLLAAALLCAVGPRWAPAMQVSHQPPEILKIAEANTASLRRLRTSVATLEVSTWERHDDGGEISRNDIHTVWVKGEKVREDYTLDRRNPGARPRIVKRELRAAGGRVQPYTMYIGQPDAARAICTPEAVISYSVADLSSRVPDPSPAFVQKGVGGMSSGTARTVLHKYATVFGTTLEEITRQHAAEGNPLSISEAQLNGVRCQVLRWAHRGLGKDSRLEVAVVPSMGYMIKKLQLFNRGKVVEEVSVGLKEYDEGVFWFERADHKLYSRESLLRSRTVVVRKMDVNVPVDDEVFTLRGMQLPPGTRVEDLTLGLRFRLDEPFNLPEDFLESVVGKGKGPPQHTEAGTIRAKPEGPVRKGEVGSYLEGQRARHAPSVESETGIRRPRLRWVLPTFIAVAIVLCALLGFVLAKRRRPVVGGPRQ